MSKHYAGRTCIILAFLVHLSSFFLTLIHVVVLECQSCAPVMPPLRASPQSSHILFVSSRGRYSTSWSVLWHIRQWLFGPFHESISSCLTYLGGGSCAYNGEDVASREDGDDCEEEENDNEEEDEEEEKEEDNEEESQKIDNEVRRIGE